VNTVNRCGSCQMELRGDGVRCWNCSAWRPGAEPLHRGGEGWKLFGVSRGVGRRLGLDVALVRVAFLIALAFTGGSALLVYFVLWALTPPSAMGKSPAQRVMDAFSPSPSARTPSARIERRI
jgi:phage shock protein C